MAFCNEKEQLYLETNVLGVGASLLQIWDGMQFSWNEAPDNAALQSIAFGSKSLTCAEISIGKTGLLACAEIGETV